MRVLFWLLLVSAAACIALSVFAPLIGLDFAVELGRGRRLLIPALLNGAGVALGLSVIGIALWFWGTLAQHRRLVNTRPDEIVLVGQKATGFKDAIAAFKTENSLPPTSVPTYLVLAVGKDGLEFWGRSQSDPIAQVAWRDITGLATGDASLPRNVPSIEISVRSHAGGTLRLPFVPSRPGWELWPIFDRQATERLVSSISGQRS